MNALRDRYFATLGIGQAGKSGLDRTKAALDRAYMLRSFEIDLYWKRGAYFWGFQVAIFAAIGLILKSDENNSLAFMPIALSSLGIVTALAARFSVLGSKFWQKNWEKHIDMLEDGFEGRLHKTVWLDRGGIYYSVSRVNEELTLYFVLFWVFTFLYTAYKLIERPGNSITPSEICRYGSLVFTLLFALAVVFAALRLCSQRTALDGTFPMDTGAHGKEAGRLRPPKREDRATDDNSIVRRRSPDEEVSETHTKRRPAN